MTDFAVITRFFIQEKEMRVVIGLTGHEGDVVARNGHFARKVLKEKPVSQLLIAGRLHGKDESGLAILQWAAEHRKLPPAIWLVDRRQEVVAAMAGFLRNEGFHAVDQRHFVKKTGSER